MSVLVEHGPGAQDRFQMHPFFQSARHTRQSTPQQSEPQTSSQKHHDSKEESNQEGSSSPGTQAADSSPSTSVTLPQVHQHEDVDVDPNQDRRKRRRITPTSDIASVYEPDASLQGRPTDLKDHGVDEGREREDGDKMAGEVNSTQPVNVTPESRRRSVRLSSTRELEQSPLPSTRQLTINLSPSKSRQAPNEPDPERSIAPKKKMLHLSSGGKLVKSPKGISVRTSGAKPSKGSSKNLSLKNGRIVSSLKVALSYSKDNVEGELATGTKIDEILGGQRQVKQDPKHSNALQRSGQITSNPDKAPHPFFLGKAALPARREMDIKVSDEASTGQNSDVEAATEIRKPKAWSEIKFSSSKLVIPKDIATISAPWPPLDTQYHGQQEVEVSPLAHMEASFRQSKHKHDIVRIPKTEDLLHQFGCTIQLLSTQNEQIRIPERRFLHPADLMTAMQGESGEKSSSSRTSPALQSMRHRLLQSRSAFDHGQAAGPHDWTHEYAPRKAEDVLQPQSRDLVEWLRKMKVHQVQSKLAATNHDQPRKAARRRGRPKKQQDDMDDFIVSSDDESYKGVNPVKNAILICGPHGCGKTASVYAAAAELDFEVFEIHPGMRRGAKDIFDRVGDMTHNHLVQQSAVLSRESSTLTVEPESLTADHEIASGKQQTMAGFINGSKKRKGKPAPIPNTAQKTPLPLQKQSVILLEEVDIIFEDDKSFWPGVQALIQQSKRPIILTCNSLQGIPLEDLSLHMTLLYERPNIEDVVEYLSHIAAAEGHLLDREALCVLYKSRGEDLRATLMDLDFWCQMTVGSKIGGLDWIPPIAQPSSGSEQLRPRVMSCRTFYLGLNLVPQKSSTPEDLLAFSKDQLGVSLLEWEAVRDYAPERDETIQLLARLDDALAISDARSCMDILDGTIAPMVSMSVSRALPSHELAVTEQAVLQLIAKASCQTKVLARKEIAMSLDPIMEDLRTFPPPVGRTSANIDGAGCSVATEVAPYVRSIVAFDQRLEQQRLELGGGSQGGKQRTTRAARAALEGGEKSYTRRERWFPKELDFEAVLRTGMGWPQCRYDQELAFTESVAYEEQ